MSHHDNHNSHHPPPDPRPEVPETPDRRSPQLDHAIIRCRCGCACVSSRAAGEGGSPDGGGGGGGGGSGVGGGGLDSLRLPAAAVSDTTSDAGDSVDGDEGAEEHLINLGDMGNFTKQALKSMLSRRNYCYCRPGVIPDLDDYPRSGHDSPAASSFLPRMDIDDTSMVAAHGGGSDIMTASFTTASACSMRSPTPNDLFAHVGTRFPPEETPLPAPRAHFFVRTPLLQTHERAFTFNCIIGTDYVVTEFPYALDFDLEERGHSGLDDHGM